MSIKLNFETCSQFEIEVKAAQYDKEVCIEISKLGLLVIGLNLSRADAKILGQALVYYGEGAK